MWHPVSLLLAWLTFALLLQWLPIHLLLGVAAASLVLALTLAFERSRSLLMRSRWLLLSLVVLFLFLTPGEYLPGLGGDLGLTYEGLWHAGTQLGRLLALLASLALLHEKAGTSGLLVGLYCLLGPFAWREATVVRLMLVLEYVEQKQTVGWREWLKGGHMQEISVSPEVYRLSMPSLHLRDKLLIGGLLTAALGLVMWWS
jgi:energy-coupling factor transport system permease protein